MSAPITFTHGERAWCATRIESEDHKHYFWKVAPAVRGRPFPAPAEYQAARRWFLATHSAPTRPQRSELRLVASP